MNFKSVGIIHTPYENDAPFTQFEDAPGVFYVELFGEYSEALYRLDMFRYFYIIFHIHRPSKEPVPRVFPPGGKGVEAGLFATRSPHRFNPIGLTLARLKKIEKNRIYTSGLDILNGTPLLDIKPYLLDFDCKTDANMGWVPEK
ncbi:MAG: tRNA (N6-threonylcarbamoyladenosine(37)-N6)-methyltransferase TrmO [Bacteroidales bacterium]|nr:tRNA (N6-threonylcarbamoyladenosine(37)-N6)-methyltransferase TrmO [Bacteroidales bacterium]